MGTDGATTLSDKARSRHQFQGRRPGLEKRQYGVGTREFCSHLGKVLFLLLVDFYFLDAVFLLL